MHFSVLFAILATAMAASIPFETSNIIRGGPSLTHAVPVSANEQENRNIPVIMEGISGLFSLTQYYVLVKASIINSMVVCVFYPSNCENAEGTMAQLTTLLQTLESSNVVKPNNRGDESFTFAGNVVNPNHPKHPFPVAVSAFRNPYFNTPLIFNHNEMPNVNHPSAGRFIPYLNSLNQFSDSSIMNTAAQDGKFLVPADTVLETIPY